MTVHEVVTTALDILGLLLIAAGVLVGGWYVVGGWSMVPAGLVVLGGSWIATPRLSRAVRAASP